MNPQEVLKEAFEEADKNFIEIAQKDSELGGYDRSGSCAIAMLIIGS